MSITELSHVYQSQIDRYTTKIDEINEQLKNQNLNVIERAMLIHLRQIQYYQRTVSRNKQKYLLSDEDLQIIADIKLRFDDKYEKYFKTIYLNNDLRGSIKIFFKQYLSLSSSPEKEKLICDYLSISQILE